MRPLSFRSVSAGELHDDAVLACARCVEVDGDRGWFVMVRLPLPWKVTMRTWHMDGVERNWAEFAAKVVWSRGYEFDWFCAPRPGGERLHEARALHNQ